VVTWHLTNFDSPLGPLTLIDDGAVLRFLHFCEPHKIAADLAVRVGAENIVLLPSPILLKAAAQLSEYFESARKTFSLPCQLEGTAFQQRLWQTLQTIPYGEVVSYGELASLAGYHKAARAVGSACNANPLPIIIPCHRVIAAHGKLGGYGGNLDRKRSLLSLEGHTQFQEKVD